VSDVPVAKKKYASYENFVAECPWCCKEIIFNRASDLRTFEPIGADAGAYAPGVCPHDG